MAKIKIRGRKDVIEIDNSRARQIKYLRFGKQDGTGKADPHEDLDLGDEWAGTIGQVDWIELDPTPKYPQTKSVYDQKTNKVKLVPLNYQLKTNEVFM